MEQLARQTQGFSGADIANVCNEAALIAARGNKPEVEWSDFMSAIDRIVGGLEKRSRIITDEEKFSIATHVGRACHSYMDASIRQPSRKGYHSAAWTSSRCGLVCPGGPP